MTNETFDALAAVIRDRKQNPAEGSYTCYLFDKGLDKILKKVGEEASEVIIAAKNGDNRELCNEVCDLLFHLLVLCENQSLPVADIYAELNARSAKIGNLKQMKVVDRNTRRPAAYFHIPSKKRFWHCWICICIRSIRGTSTPARARRSMNCAPAPSRRA